jgi:short-subunit dehydrogenase
VAGNEKSKLFKMGAMTAAEVAADGYRAMMAGSPMVVHGLKNKFSAWSVRLSPRALVTAIAASLNKP